MTTRAGPQHGASAVSSRRVSVSVDANQRLIFSRWTGDRTRSQERREADGGVATAARPRNAFWFLLRSSQGLLPVFSNLRHSELRYSADASDPTRGCANEQPSVQWIGTAKASVAHGS